MEQNPRPKDELGLTNELMRPAPLSVRPRPTRAESERRFRRAWDARRRRAAARMYRTFSLLGSGDLRNRMTMDMVGRWIVEESAAPEASRSIRAQRRVLLMQRWKSFVRSALDMRNQGRRR